MKLYTGILEIYTKSLKECEQRINQMPPGDVRAERLEIITKVRGYIVAVENTLSQGRNPAPKFLDEIEVWLSKL